MIDQIVEVGKSFAVGEPFLRGGKVRPVCGAYLPAHFSGKLVAVQAGLLTDHLLKLGKGAVEVENADGKQSIPADTIVIAAGAKPNNDLYEALKDKLPKVDAIGDSVSVGRINNAVASAYQLAMTI